MPVTALLQQFVDYEIDGASPLIERTRVGTLALLRDPKSGALLPSERTQQASIVEALTTRASAFAEAFGASLRRQVTEALASADGTATSAARPGGRLELMDESRVEIDIEISRAVQLIDTTAEWELRELQTFTSTLVGLKHVSAESNPLRPLAYTTALWNAACAVLPQQAQRTITLRIASGVMAGLLKSAWAAASTRLESLGVEPSVYRTVLLAPGSVPEPPRTPRRPTSAFAALLADAPVVAANAGSVVRSVGSAAPGVRAEPVGSRVAELIARLFRAFAADDQVSAEARVVLVRWQDPVLRLALRDDTLLAGLDHPAWRVIDRIAQFGEEFAAGEARQQRLLGMAAKLATAASAVDGVDAEPFRQALRSLDELAAEQRQEQLHGAQETIEQLGRLERRDLLEHRLAERLVEQAAGVRVTPPIRRFVTGAWARVVAQAMVEHGEQHAQTQAYVRAVDDLLWSVAAPNHPNSRQRLLTILPALLDTLRAGMASIALPDAEKQAVLDELMAIHTETLRPRSAAEGEQLTPQQIVQRLRDEVIEQDEPARRFGDSVIDVASMETVPAEFMPTDIGGAGTSPEVIAVGAVRRMFIGGRWTHAQLLWRSEQGQYLLFAGEGAGRTHSITRRAFERLQAARLVRPIEQRPLVARTLDTLMHQLSLT